LWHSYAALSAHPDIDQVYVAIGAGQETEAAAALTGLKEPIFVQGGATRRESVHLGLVAIAAHAAIDQVLIHDAARPFLPTKVIEDLLDALLHAPGAVPTDDARMLMAQGRDVRIVPGAEALNKFTFSSDFAGNNMSSYRSGNGFDVHRLVPGAELWLCGVQIPHDRGLDGHSDADVAMHALTDAILGAIAKGDIGDHFPPSDPQWRGASSDRFLTHAIELARADGFELSNADITIICEQPKVGPYRGKMRERLAEIMSVDVDRISVKATTTEMLGFTGRGEGIAAQATATFEKI
jgi:2-C-methyl-D-erythritol 4-phosphate cytidylyltransferase/2-C-methyl-D-erythritol 2,4-cyclodiphosphate synthase